MQTIASFNIEKSLTSLRAYKPLIVALPLILVATYLLELARSSGGLVFLHELMNAFMGFFFVVFSLPKFIDVMGFASSFRRYDTIAKHSASYAKLYPVIELSLGLLFLSNFATNSLAVSRFANSAVMIITISTLVGAVASLRRGDKVDCACLGSRFKYPLSTVVLVENGVMLAMAFGMLFFYHSFHLDVFSLTHLRMLHG